MGMFLQSDIPSDEELNVKIHLSFENVFLSLSFGFYLKDYLGNIEEADFIITDNKSLKQKYKNLPICLVGYDIELPCTVYEMFSQLHDFYNNIDSNNRFIFHSNIKNIAQNEMKSITDRRSIKAKNDRERAIEELKKQKLMEVMKNIDPNLGDRIESLFDDLSRRIIDSLDKKVK